ncbi:MAG: HEAT repeat domain-containing protein [Uliginosibacterium sp.]|nr:HEAT repeat domain-containing protein [Uliginosibacterium sp.]
MLAIDALRRVGTEDEWRVIFPLLKHESASVRSAAIRFARAVLGDRAKEFLSNALTDPAPLVRENALDELDGLVTNDLRPIITSLLQDESPSVREAAQSLLDTL